MVGANRTNHGSQPPPGVMAAAAVSNANGDLQRLYAEVTTAAASLSQCASSVTFVDRFLAENSQLRKAIAPGPGESPEDLAVDWFASNGSSIRRASQTIGSHLTEATKFGSEAVAALRSVVTVLVLALNDSNASDPDALLRAAAAASATAAVDPEGARRLQAQLEDACGTAAKLEGQLQHATRMNEDHEARLRELYAETSDIREAATELASRYGATRASAAATLGKATDSASARVTFAHWRATARASRELKCRDAAVAETYRGIEAEMRRADEQNAQLTVDNQALTDAADRAAEELLTTKVRLDDALAAAVDADELADLRDIVEQQRRDLKLERDSCLDFADWSMKLAKVLSHHTQLAVKASKAKGDALLAGVQLAVDTALDAVALQVGDVVDDALAEQAVIADAAIAAASEEARASETASLRCELDEAREKLEKSLADNADLLELLGNAQERYTELEGLVDAQNAAAAEVATSDDASPGSAVSSSRNRRSLSHSHRRRGSSISAVEGLDTSGVADSDDADPGADAIARLQQWLDGAKRVMAEMEAEAREELERFEEHVAETVFSCTGALGALREENEVQQYEMRRLEEANNNLREMFVSRGGGASGTSTPGGGGGGMSLGRPRSQSAAGPALSPMTSSFASPPRGKPRAMSSASMVGVPQVAEHFASPRARHSGENASPFGGADGSLHDLGPSASVVSAGGEHGEGALGSPQNSEHPLSEPSFGASLLPAPAHESAPRLHSPPSVETAASHEPAPLQVRAISSLDVRLYYADASILAVPETADAACDTEDLARLQAAPVLLEESSIGRVNSDFDLDLAPDASDVQAPPPASDLPTASASPIRGDATLATEESVVAEVPFDLEEPHVEQESRCDAEVSAADWDHALVTWMGQALDAVFEDAVCDLAENAMYKATLLGEAVIVDEIAARDRAVNAVETTANFVFGLFEAEAAFRREVEAHEALDFADLIAASHFVECACDARQSAIGVARFVRSTLLGDFTMLSAHTAFAVTEATGRSALDTQELLERSRIVAEQDRISTATLAVHHHVAIVDNEHAELGALNADEAQGRLAVALAAGDALLDALCEWHTFTTASSDELQLVQLDEAEARRDIFAAAIDALADASVALNAEVALLHSTAAGLAEQAQLSTTAATDAVTSAAAAAERASLGALTCVSDEWHVQREIAFEFAADMQEESLAFARRSARCTNATIAAFELTCINMHEYCSEQVSGVLNALDEQWGDFVEEADRAEALRSRDVKAARDEAESIQSELRREADAAASKLKARVEHLESEVEALEHRLEAVGSTESEAQEAARQAATRLAAVETDRDASGARATELQELLDIAEAAIAEREDALEAAESRLQSLAEHADALAESSAAAANVVDAKIQEIDLLESVAGAFADFWTEALATAIADTCREKSTAFAAAAKRINADVTEVAELTCDAVLTRGERALHQMQERSRKALEAADRDLDLQALTFQTLSAWQRFAQKQRGERSARFQANLAALFCLEAEARNSIAMAFTNSFLDLASHLTRSAAEAIPPPPDCTAASTSTAFVAVAPAWNQTVLDDPPELSGATISTWLQHVAERIAARNAALLDQRAALLAAAHPPREKTIIADHSACKRRVSELEQGMDTYRTQLDRADRACVQLRSQRAQHFRVCGEFGVLAAQRARRCKTGTNALRALLQWRAFARERQQQRLVLKMEPQPSDRDGPSPDPQPQPEPFERTQTPAPEVARRLSEGLSPTEELSLDLISEWSKRLSRYDDRVVQLDTSDAGHRLHRLESRPASKAPSQEQQQPHVEGASDSHATAPAAAVAAVAAADDAAPEIAATGPRTPCRHTHSGTPGSRTPAPDCGCDLTADF